MTRSILKRNDKEHSASSIGNAERANAEASKNLLSLLRFLPQAGRLHFPNCSSGVEQPGSLKKSPTKMSYKARLVSASHLIAAQQPTEPEIRRRAKSADGGRSGFGAQSGH